MAINWNDYYNQALTEYEPTYQNRVAQSNEAKAGEISALDTQKAQNQTELEE